MNTLTEILDFLTYYLVDQYWFPAFLIGTGIFFTIYLGFPQIKYFKHGWRILSGKYIKDDTEGDTTPFQALTTALSGTVGTGNIGGVALAIFLGGPAAIFWMWVTAFLGMTTKFVEVTLSHKYREKLPDGSMSGGPMYYIENGLNMKWLAVVFSVCLLMMCLGTGNMPQISSISVVLLDTFNIPKIVTGLVLSVLVWLVIIGGIKRIAQIASKLVPFMAFWYIVGGLAVIISNYENIIPSFQSIFIHIFTPTAAVGGFLGASVAAALTRGVNRGLYSNEAGQGSAPIAHASSKTENPIEEGMVSILEPFIDTIIICTLTGLVILSSGVWNQKFENKFEASAMVFVSGQYLETKQEDAIKLRDYYYGTNSEIEYTGEVAIVDGEIKSEEVTLLHNRSIAENTKIYSSSDNSLYSGLLNIEEGRITNIGDYVLRGDSLLLGADLTGKAFTKSIFGDFGQYIVAIGLLLFAFSTVIAWSYYGDRATAHLFGEGWILYYRIIYVGAFFTASIIDTKIVWDIATVIGPIATIPNLIALIFLRKEMKQIDAEYEIRK
ncbi:MAG: sodium:alanine symporter family protein [Pseudomonadota bacterium]|mgnify:CR=1 FL=1|nr:sodium:alanine symporter family protein [Gammaproteobacteria bacterium]MEC7917482.1 sodium:alanine symporter family protein [Pseudomonadota bacterium]|tara:strand:- start:94 stop:1746 length:1653 start_codon:yes stop_codon:yes gene_type:complete